MKEHYFKQWFLPDVGDDARKGINDNNIRMMSRVIPVFLVLCSALLLFYSIISLVRSEDHSLALISLLVCVALFLLTFFLLKRLRRDALASSKKNMARVFDVVYFAFSAWGIWVSWRLYVSGSQMLIMDSVQLVFVLFLCCYPLWGGIRIAISYAVLFFILFQTDGAEQINLPIYCLMTGMLCFGTVIRYGMELRNIEQMHELASHASSLEKLSKHDELTGMKNRIALREDFSGFCGQNIWVIMADVDHFKRYNDTYGHSVGDQILNAFATEIKILFGKETSYRYGGDEFLIILKDCTKTEITTLLTVWKSAVSNIRLEGIPEEDDFSCSYGYVKGTPLSEEKLRTMVAQADRKLYEMKKCCA